MRHYSPWLLAALLWPALVSAQLTIRVTSLPANTPANAPVYLAGTPNNWNPAGSLLTPGTDGVLSVTLTPAVGTVEFKFTRGAWASVEGNSAGGYLPNRTLQYNGTPKTVDLTILSWEDLGGGNPTGNNVGVSILDNDFYIPQLNRYRRIWVYLPPDYATYPTKRYPVLYLQDGQNLFDASTSFSGEWEIDESLNSLFANGDYGCIVIGIDNGGTHRLDEYSPWINATYGGGEGEAYLEFITNTLKPYVDTEYRTLPNRLTTGVGGSSMGGLFAQYALMDRQDVFSKAAVFSPAFWFAGNSPASQVLAEGKQADVRTYFLAGGNEPQYVEDDMQDVADAMLNAGFGAGEINFNVVAGGEHSEWFWRQEFPDAYVWLFAGAVSSTTQPIVAATPHWEIFPNPARDWVQVTAPGQATGQKLHYQIVGADGKIWSDSLTTVGSNISTRTLPAGLYFLQLQIDGQAATASERFVVLK